MNANELAQALVQEHGSDARAVAAAVLYEIDKLNGDVAAQAIVTACAHYFDVSQAELLGPRHYREIAEPRSVCMALMRIRLGWTYQRVSEYFGRSLRSIQLRCARVTRSNPDVRAVERLIDRTLEAAE